MEESCGSTSRSHDFACAREWAVWSYDRDVWSRENVLAGAELNTRKISAVRLERSDIFFVEAVEAEIVVEEEPGIVGEDVLHTPGLKLNGFFRSILNPCFAQ